MAASTAKMIRCLIGSPLRGLAPPHPRREIAQEILAPSVHALAPGWTPSAAAGSGSSVHQLRMRGRRSARAFDRRRHGREPARLPVEAGEVARDRVGPHLRVARREAESQPLALDRAGAGMRSSKIICAVWVAEKPAGTGSANSTTPKTSARSASVVRRSKTVLRPSQMRTNCPPQPGCDGSSDRPCSSQPTDGLSPILIVPFELGREEIAERAAARDVRRHERRVAPLARLVAADEPAAIGRVRLDDPQLGVVLLDVVVGVDAPHLVRPADEVDAELRQDVGRIVQRLGEVVDAAPDEHIERPRIVAPRAPDDPVGAFRRCPEPRPARTLERALLRDRPQRVGRGYRSEYVLRLA